MKRRAHVRVIAASCVAVAGFFFGGASPGLAHTIADPRVLVLVPKGDGLEIRVNDLEQPGDASVELRKRYDGNHDGKIDDSESSDLGGFLVARAITNLRLWQNGRALPLTEVSRAVRGVGNGVDASESVSIDVVLSATPAPSADGRVTVTVGDFRADAHAIRAAALAQGVKMSAVSSGTLDPNGDVATEIKLDHDTTWTVTYSGVKKSGKPSK